MPLILSSHLIFFSLIPQFYLLRFLLYYLLPLSNFFPIFLSKYFFSQFYRLVPTKPDNSYCSFSWFCSYCNYCVVGAFIHYGLPYKKYKLYFNIILYLQNFILTVPVFIG